MDFGFYEAFKTLQADVAEILRLAVDQEDEMATFREEMRAANQATADSVAAVKEELDAVKAEVDALTAGGVPIPPQLQSSVDAIKASVDAMSPHVDTIQANTEDLRTQLDEAVEPNP